MENKNKEIKVESLGHSISSVLLESIVIHQNAMLSARFGAVSMDDRAKRHPNRTRIRRLQILGLVISSQMAMIRVSKPFVRLAIEKQEGKEVGKKQEDGDKNDYEKLIELSVMLKQIDKYLRHNGRRNNPKTAFIQTIEQPENGYDVGDCKLTENFFDMITELEETYDDINYIITCHGLITTIIEEAKPRRNNSGIY